MSAPPPRGGTRPATAAVPAVALRAVLLGAVLPRAVLLPAVLLACALLAGACASAPPPAPPELPVEVPAAWQAPALAGPPEDDWWSGLGGPRLDALVEEALAANLDLAAAAARVDAAAAQARIAGADARPQVSADLGAARRRQNFIGFPIPGGGERVLSTTTTTFSTGLDVSWELDLWGRLRATESAAVARTEATAADLAAARLSLAGRVARSWFGVLEAAQQVALARETAASRERTRERVRRRYELGLRPALDLRLALANHAAAEALLALRERQLDAARRRVELLLGRYPAGDLGPSAARTASADPPEPGLPPAVDRAAAGEAAAFAPLPDVPEPPAAEREVAPAGGPWEELPVSPEPVPAGVPAAVLARRPDLLAAERRLAAAGLAVDEAQAARLPRISLTGSAGRSSGELEDLLDDDFTVWSLAGGLLQPIFQGGRLRAAVDLAEARRAEALAAWQRAALAAFAEVEQALAAEAFLRRREAALEEAVEQSTAALEQAVERYTAGLVDYLTVLESERQALEARSQLLTARRERLEARVDLHLALGGGFAAAAGEAAETATAPLPPAEPPAVGGASPASDRSASGGDDPATDPTSPRR